MKPEPKKFGLFHLYHSPSQVWHLLWEQEKRRFDSFMVDQFHMIQSPCIKICELQNNVCTGCFRNLNEIRHWTKLDDRERKVVMENVSRRKTTFKRITNKDEP